MENDKDNYRKETRNSSSKTIFLVLSLSILLLLPNVFALSTTGSVDWNSNVGQIRSDFYGVNVQNPNLLVGSNYTQYRQAILDMGIKSMRFDASLGSFYGGAYNFGFEDWGNTTVGIRNTTGYSGAHGWEGGVNSNINVSFKASTTDVHSGTYALNATWISGAQVGYVDFRPIYTQSNKLYNATIWIKGSGSVLYKFNNYTGSTCSSQTITLTSTWTQYNLTCYGNESYGAMQLVIDGIGSGEHILLDDWYITEDNQEFFWRLSNLNSYINMSNWSYENNITLMPIISYMPTYLSSTKSGGCTINLTGSIVGTCSTERYDLYGRMVKDYIDWLANGSTTIRNTFDVEFWNEPTGQFFMTSLAIDHINKSIEYNKLYNATKYYMDLNFPNMDFGGTGFAVEGDSVNVTDNFLNNFFANYTNNDFCSLHDYSNVNISPKEHYDNQTNIFNQLANSKGAVCSRTIWSEWNMVDSAVTTNESQDKYKSQYSSAYMGFLNNQYVSNLSVMTYKFSEDGESYRYSMYYNFSKMTPYNITKLFATNHKANNMVVTSSITDSTVKIVASKDSNGQKYITLTNTNTSAFNVTLRTNVAMRDVETNTIYPVNSSGDIYIPNMASYGVSTLTSVNTTVITLMSTQIGVVRSDFYGANQPWELSNTYNYSNSQDNVRNISSNITLTRGIWEDAKLKNMRMDGGLQDVTSSYTLGSGNSATRKANIDLIKYAYDNNITFTWVADYMPYWLADNTTGMCTSTNNWGYCPPTNYTKWGEVVLAGLNNHTNNGQYISAIRVEVWNEPQFATWLGNLSTDHINKSIEYNKLFNATYWAIKNVYPNVKILGLGGATDYNGNITRNWFANFSSINEGYTIHQYADDMTEANTFNNTISSYKSTCNSYSAINCNELHFNEYNIASAYFANTYSAVHGGIISSILTQMVNGNISSQTIFKFSSPYINKSGDGQYNYSIYNQPTNTKSNIYNITKLFTRYAPAQGTIYNTSITDEGNVIKVVSSKINNKQNLIITNTENGQRNITLSCGSFTGNLIDVSSGTLYSCASGSVNLGVTDEYEVRYLTEPVEANGAWYNYLGEYLAPVTGYSIGSTCDPTTISFYQIILNLSALAIIGVVLFLIFRDGWEEITIQQMLIAGIAIIVGAILFQASADNLGIGACP